MPQQAYTHTGYQPHRYHKRILLAVIGLTPQVIAGGKKITLSPILVAFYWLFIDDCFGEGVGIHYNTTADLTLRFLRNYALLVGAYSGDYVQTEQSLKREGIDKAYFEEKLSRIKKAFEKALGKERALPYLPVANKPNQPKKLILSSQAITKIKYSPCHD